jgi:hypothetical protein
MWDTLKFWIDIQCSTHRWESIHTVYKTATWKMQTVEISLKLNRIKFYICIESDRFLSPKNQSTDRIRQSTPRSQHSIYTVWNTCNTPVAHCIGRNRRSKMLTSRVSCIEGVDYWRRDGVAPTRSWTIQGIHILCKEGGAQMISMDGWHVTEAYVDKRHVRQKPTSKSKHLKIKTFAANLKCSVIKSTKKQPQRETRKCRPLYKIKHLISLYQLSRFFSLASLSYFSNVRLSTWPVKYLKWNKTSLELFHISQIFYKTMDSIKKIIECAHMLRTTQSFPVSLTKTSDCRTRANCLKSASWKTSFKRQFIITRHKGHSSEVLR